MPYIKDNDGGQLLNAEQFYYTIDEHGRKILNVAGGGGAAGVTSVNGKRGNVTLTADDIPAGTNSQQFTNADKTELNQATTDITNLKTSVNNKFDKSGGTMTGDINMGSHNITNVEKIAINGNNPLFIGSVVEPASDAPRMTATNDGKMAFVKANTQNTYVPVSVGEPQSADDAATKRYVDNAIADIRGIPDGGTIGQALVKRSGTDGDVEWATVGGGGGGNLPASTTADAGKFLVVNVAGNAEWSNTITIDAGNI